jgi:histidinol-phosphate aminotransferase
MEDLHRYPNGGLDLRRELARQYEVRVENVIAGSGSEGIMSNIIRAFLCDEDEVLTTESAFIGFQVLAKSRGVKYRTVPYKNWHYDLEALAAAVNERTKIIYLANPNNPTGTIFTRLEFDRFYAHVPERVLIILDEAYFEYAKDNPRYPDSMHYRYDNVITLRTFSKVYGLAGLRCGYALCGDERFRVAVEQVRQPFFCNALAQAAAEEALKHQDEITRRVELMIAERLGLEEELRGMGLQVADAQANFLWHSLGSNGSDLDADAERAILDGLAERKVLIRSGHALGRTGWARTTIGTPAENQRFLDALRELL